MDQSVAIQETLAEGEYCIIISFPALSSQPRRLPWPREVDQTVTMCLSAFLPFSVPSGKKEASIYYILTQYWTLPGALHTIILPTHCEVGDSYPHFTDGEGSER